MVVSEMIGQEEIYGTSKFNLRDEFLGFKSCIIVLAASLLDRDSVAVPDQLWLRC